MTEKITKIGLVCVILLAGCQNKKETAKDIARNKQEFIRNCREGAIEQAKAQGLDISEQVIADYCECSATYIFEELTVEEIKQLENQEAEELINKMQTIVTPCLEEFVEKISESLEEKAEKLHLNEQ